MMNVRLLGTDDPAWTEALQGQVHDVYHLPEYLQAEDDFRGDSSHLIVATEGDHSLLVPITFKEIQESGGLLDASSPYGYPAPIATEYSNPDWIRSAVEALFSFLRDMGVVSVFLRFHPLIGLSPKYFSQHGVQVEHGMTVAVELGRPVDEIRSDMRQGHRYDIRKALRAGQDPKLDADWAYFEDFLDIYRQTMDRVGATSAYYFSRKYFERLRDDLADNVFLWVTKIDDSVAAASLITMCSGTVQYHLSGTHSDFLKEYPTKVLLDAVASWANDQGATNFHLGGGLGSQEDSLFRFKSGFSKKRQAFSTVRVILNGEAYSRLTKAWEGASGAQADPPGGFFPAYRKPVQSS